MFKKTLILIMIVSFSVLVGCSKKEIGNINGNEGKQNENGEAEEQTLEFVFYLDGIIIKRIEEKTTKNNGITITPPVIDDKEIEGWKNSHNEIVDFKIAFKESQNFYSKTIDKENNGEFLISFFVGEKKVYTIKTEGGVS